MKAILAIWIITLMAVIMLRTRQSRKLARLADSAIENRCAGYSCFYPINCWNCFALVLAFAIAVYSRLYGYPKVFLIIFLFASISLAYYLQFPIILAENGILYETAHINWQDISFYRLFHKGRFRFLSIRASRTDSAYAIPIPSYQVNQLDTRKVHEPKE